MCLAVNIFISSVLEYLIITPVAQIITGRTLFNVLFFTLWIMITYPVVDIIFQSLFSMKFNWFKNLKTCDPY